MKMLKKIDRTGETRIMNNGLEATITVYRNNLDIDVQFEDGTIVEHRNYSAFKKGQISNISHQDKANARLYEARVMNNGMKATIIVYRNYKDIDVQFENGTIVKHKEYGSFKNGNIACPNIIIKNQFAKQKNQSAKLKYTGETRMMNCGMKATITIYRNNCDIDIQFEDGTIVEHKRYGNFRGGNIAHPKKDTRNQSAKLKHIGEARVMNNGMKAIIIVYRNYRDIDVQFEDGTIIKHKEYASFKIGTIANPNYQMLSGVSYNELICSFYLQQLGFQKAEKNSLPELGRKELDLYHPNLNGFRVAVEYDGYINTNGGHTIENDLEKNKLCEDADILLFRIREPHLSKLNSTSTDYCLSTRKIRSKNLERVLNLVLQDICKKCSCNFDLVVNFERDEELIDQFIGQYHNSKSRLGKTRMMNCGMMATIIAYRDSRDIDIRFENGIIVKHRTYKSFMKGYITCSGYKRPSVVSYNTSASLILDAEIDNAQAS